MLIPEDKLAAVTRGLESAFHVTDFDDITPVTGGQTNSLVFRVTVRGTPYLLKLILRNEDPARHYTSMRAAADAGLAPRIWYTSVEDRISITDFVRCAPDPLPRSEALVRLPALLRELHALRPFAEAPFNTTCTYLLGEGPAVDGYLQKFLSSGLLPPGGSEEFAARLAELKVAYSRDPEDLVACHNDLFKPDNILFDGDRLWLVDWEAAFLNDRYADLVVVANQLVRNEDEEVAFLSTYFGAPPTSIQRTKFHRMQQLSHLFYTMAFLSIGAAGTKKPVDWNAPALSFGDFHERLWTVRDLDLADPEVKVLHGRVDWERLIGQPRCSETQSSATAS